MTTIPRIIHQINFGRNDSYIEKYEKNINILKEKNQDFAYYQWNDDDAQELIIRRQPHLYTHFKKLNVIDKSDFFRYILMYEYGGFYFDLDVEFHKSLHDFFQYTQIFFRQVRGTNRLPSESTVENFDPAKYDIIVSSENFLKNGRSYVNNFILASTPKNDFWLHLLNESLNHTKPNYSLLTFCLEKYRPEKTLILPPFYFGWGNYMETPRPDWVVASHHTTQGNRKVLLCSHALNVGGAERWLLSLAKNLPNVVGIYCQFPGELDSIANKYVPVFYRMEDALKTHPDIGIIWGNCAKELEQHIPIMAVSHGTPDIPYSKEVCQEMEKRTKFIYSVSKCANSSWSRRNRHL